MYKINLKARAKINISLDVLDKRPDGYHNVKMIMQTINLYDKLCIKKIYKNTIIIKTNLSFLPTDERNLVFKVIKYIKDNYNINRGVFVDLYKVIPVAAGLAGGSADAAAAIIGMNKLFNLKLSMEEMMQIGQIFGADIPYCIVKGTALCEGIGEKITYLEPFPKAYIVIAKPNISVSTAAVYGELNLSSINIRPNTDELLDGINNYNLDKICNNMQNILENVTINKYPIIQRIKNIMLENGAKGSLMSGSGPTVFGIFENKDKANKLAHKLKAEKIAKFIYTTTIYNRD